MFSCVLDAVLPRPSLGDWSAVELAPRYEGRAALASRGVKSLDGVLSVVSYEESQCIQQAIIAMKYRRIAGLAAPLVQCMLQADHSCFSSSSVLVPVPLHWRRCLQRGFNQSVLLARHVSWETDMSVQCVLRRTKDTGHQAWRTRSQRMGCMSDVFTARRMTVPRRVIIIDDIMTTGATLDACAATLKRAGAKQVKAWVVARA